MAKADQPTGVLRVLAGFVGEVGGERINFREGQLIDADHPAVRKWPQAFGPLHVQYQTARPRIEQATAAPGEKRGDR